MLRTFKQFNVATGGAPQPLIGTTISANVLATVPGTNPDALFVIPVADSSMFLKGDTVVIGKPSVAEERLRVFAVIDSTHIQVSGVLANAYGSSSYIRLSNMVANIYVQTKIGNSAAIFIGTADNMAKATMTWCIAQLYQVSAAQPNAWSYPPSAVANSEDVANIWVDGTTSDSYTPSLGSV